MATTGPTFARRRTEWLFLLFAIGYLILAARLIDIQFFRRGEFRQLANRFHHRRLIIPATRGGIFDRAGRELATTIPTKSIYVDPSIVKDKSKVATTLASFLGMDRDEIFNKINRETSFVWIKRRVPYALGMKIKKENIRGIGVVGESRRIYPGGRNASHILGFTNIDGIGLEGIENSYDRLIHGRDGYIQAEVDAKQRVIAGTRQVLETTRDGSQITLTIDQEMQYALENELRKAYTAYKAAAATAVVLDPRTGEILAMANMPDYDPNNPSKSDSASRRNRAVTDLYEPGSTLKTITMAAALEENVSSNFYCSGRTMIGKRPIRCVLHAPYYHGHGNGDYRLILLQSCNIGAATTGLRLGGERLYRYEEAFGLTKKPGSGLPGEQKGLFGLPVTWPDIRVANVSFGQGVAVSALQVATAYGAIANGGVLMRPQIVREVRGSDGKVQQSFKPIRVRRVVSPETARKLIPALEAVVMDGTGRPAKIAGYRVAGKTGSAQKARLNGRGYEAGKFISSFVGFLPAEKPRAVILVAIDEPKGSHWGATTAAPVFREVARSLMWTMRVPPDDPNDEIDGARLSTFRERDKTKDGAARSVAGRNPM